MNRYTIYCSEAQTKKALELGAPIEVYNHFDSDDIREANIFYKDKFIELSDGKLAERTTAEQVINWFEEQNIYIHIDPCSKISCSWYISTWGYNEFGYVSHISTCHSRKEATLAAIDAALEYLSNNLIK